MIFKSKKLLTLTLSTLIVGTLSTSVLAGTISANSSSFTSDWQLHRSGDNNKANLTYGYNTAWINEDYAWATHSENESYAMVKNGNGTHIGPVVSPRRTSKIEVRHSGSSVYYYCDWK